MGRIEGQPIQHTEKSAIHPQVIEQALPLTPSHVENGNGLGKVFDANGHIPAYDGPAFPYDSFPEIRLIQEKPVGILDRFLAEPQVVPLGEVVQRTDIESSLRPFKTLPEYRTYYPDTVVGAIGELFNEYNAAFDPIVAANLEWDTDYQYTRYGSYGKPVNRWVQIDMVGLPQGFLDQASSMEQDTVREAIRPRIFEFENSIAMYQLLERIFSRNEDQSQFDRVFRASLDDLRARYGKPIALLALTPQKHHAMRESEFGKFESEPLPDLEVQRLTGFDKMFGPEEFLEHVSIHGDSEYLLFVRASEPVDKLRKPTTFVENPLLEDNDIRRVIKANAITFNLDRPDTPMGSPARINDTKAYLPTMGMAYRADNFDDVFSQIIRSKNQVAVILNPELQAYLRKQGVDPSAVAAGNIKFRAKPMEASYGCYGHISVKATDGDTRKDLEKGLRNRGPYIIQPEMETPVLINETTGQAYTYIDRNFFAADGRSVTFMGGFRSLMPIDSQEAKNGRVHGNGSTVWAEIS